MGMSFKAKNKTNSNEQLSSRAVFVLGELKKNVLNAELGRIECPSGVGSSIAFATKDGGMTILQCLSAQIASVSASSGTFNFLENGVSITNCATFVECNLASSGEVDSVSFNLDLQVTNEDGYVTGTGSYYGVATPRE